MVDIYPHIMITHKLFGVHEVIGIITIKKSLVGWCYKEQREGKIATQISGTQINIRKSKLRNIEPLEQIKMESIIIILPTGYTPKAFGKRQTDDGVFVHNISSTDFILEKLLMGCPTKRSGNLRHGKLMSRIIYILRQLVHIVQGIGGLLLPILHPNCIRQMVLEFFYIAEAKNIIVQQIGIIASRQ